MPSTRRPLSAALLLAAGLWLTGASPARADGGGWTRLELPESGSHAWLYVPLALAASPDPLPLVVFFHGAGGQPESYLSIVAPAADGAGVAALLPAPHGLGWGNPGDRETLDEALRRTGQQLALDPRRIALAGYSAGGAYAYLLAYLEGVPASGVFTLGAPFYPVPQLADPGYRAPIRMYYGTADPNYTGGAAARLVEQWDRLGVPWERTLGEGNGHNTLPAAEMAAGFAFLAAQQQPAPAGGCVPSDTALCLRDGRFRLEVSWDDGRGGQGTGHVVPGVATGGSGLFWFFRQDNWEMLVKVLDGCPVNGRFWVFAAATTNVGYTLTVTDTLAQRTWTTSNPAGRTAPAVTATDALDTCG